MTLKLNESGGSLNDRIEQISRSWREGRENLPEQKRSYVVDVFEDHVVITVGDWGDPKRKYYQVSYSVEGDVVAFAEQWTEVALSYVAVVGSAEGEPPQAVDPELDPPAAEAPDAEAVMEAFRGLVESNAQGQPEAVILVEGVSLNKNRYTRAAIESGIKVFEGAKMYADHPTRSEERDRPERSVRDLVGKLGTPYVGTDKAGKVALRAPIVFSETADWLKTLVKEGISDALSIRANGAGKRDKSSGEFVVESFVQDPHTSVDFVTIASAGGYAQLTESAGLWASISEQDIRQHRPDLLEKLNESPSEAEIVRLQEANNTLIEENAKLFKQARLQEANSALTLILKPGLPSVALDRVRQQAAPLMEAFSTHGSEQTVEQLRDELAKLMQSEREYIAKIMPNGAVSGLGHQQPNPGEEAEQILEEAFHGLVPANQIQIAVKGRTN